MKTQSHLNRAGRTWLVLLAFLAMIAALVQGLSACAELGGTATSASGIIGDTDATSAAPASEPYSSEAGPVPPSTTEITGAVSHLSQESLDYALWLGGASHKGETLCFVIGASVGSEAQAQALLEPAKAVGDMQSNFIVQLSDNFEGMNPGYWVVFEAYDGYPSVEDLEFCRRPFPDAYVKQAKVLTDDPIPVRPGG